MTVSALWLSWLSGWLGVVVCVCVCQGADHDRHVLATIWQAVDADGSGMLECSEIGQVMARMGRKLTHEEVHSLFAEIDLDGSGSIDFGEFLAWWRGQADSDRRHVAEALQAEREDRHNIGPDRSKFHKKGWMLKEAGQTIKIPPRGAARNAMDKFKGAESFVDSVVGKVDNLVGAVKFQKRWFELTGDKLRWYEDGPDAHGKLGLQKGQIMIGAVTGVREVQERPNAPPFMFETEIAEGGYKHIDNSSKAKRHTVPTKPLRPPNTIAPPAPPTDSPLTARCALLRFRRPGRSHSHRPRPRANRSTPKPWRWKWKVRWLSALLECTTCAGSGRAAAVLSLDPSLSPLLRCDAAWMDLIREAAGLPRSMLL